jgi:hypothetical protein
MYVNDSQLRTRVPDHPQAHNRNRNQTLLVTTLAVIALCVFAIPTYAQGSGSLSIGMLATNGSAISCGSGSGFYYYVYPNTGLALDMNCQSATVNSCSQVINGQTVTVAPWNLTIGYLNPMGVVPGVTVANGLVILHGGSGGTAPESYALADGYFRAGFEVVQVVWADDWEMISDPITSGLGNVQAAACRPATAFNWIFQNLFLPTVFSHNNQAGMCALGDSAGSAAVAYSLAYYNAGSYLDNVELLSGPVLSDIEQGCEEPPPSSVTVCPPGNFECLLGGDSDWTLPPTYLSGPDTGVSTWTNIPGCGTAGVTSQISDLTWQAQSIVDNGPASGGATPTFTYSSTAMSGWLCRTVQNNNNYACANNGNNNYNSCPNNSSPQGWLYYNSILPGSAPPHYAVYSVDSCVTAEGVTGGTVPGFYPLDFGGTQSGWGNASGITAIIDDMVGSAPAQIPAQCVHRIHTQ